MLATHAEEYFAHFAQERTVGYTEYLVACMRWISEWAENIKDGTDANFAARWANMLHGWMIGRGEHEAKPDFVDATGDLFGAKVDAYSKGFKDIGTPTAAGSGAIAMFGNDCPCCGGENTGGSGYVEGTGTVTTGTTGIEGMLAFQMDLYSLVAHNTGQTGNFLNGFPTRAKA